MIMATIIISSYKWIVNKYTAIQVNALERKE